MDKPYNLFPSLHITLGMLILSSLLPVTPRVWKVPLCIWFALIFISTLTTHQHQVVDLFGGFALGVACMHSFPWQSDTRKKPAPKTWAPRLAMLYAVPTLLLAIGAWFLRPWGVLLLWPAWSLGAMSVCYLGIGSRVFGKTNGRIAWPALISMAPVIFAQRLSRAWYAKKSPAWSELAPGIFIGRALNNAEALNAVKTLGLTAVLDLTAEASEAPAFLQLNYLNIQVPDLTAPSPEQLEEGVAFIQNCLATGCRLYIHCKAGYSRTSAISGAWLIRSGLQPSTAEAAAHLKTCRPGIVIRPEAMACLR